MSTMNKNAPIGVFDSGLGGLSVVRAVKSLMPGEDVIYLGDTARVPYGSKSRDIIIQYAIEDIDFLRKFDCKLLIAACGTVSTNIPADFADDFTTPFTGIVGPTAYAAVHASKNKRIGFIGTAASVRSGRFQEEILRLCPEAEVFQTPCPILVPLVENNFMEKKPTLVEGALEYYLKEFDKSGIDTLILGCTHYPALEDFIRRAMPDITLVDSGYETATYAKKMLSRASALCERDAGERKYFVTDDAEMFADTAHVFLGEDIDGEVSLVRLS